MPKRNSSGSSAGRRGASRSTSTGRGRSSDKSFKKTDRRESGASGSKKSDRGFGNKSSASRKSTGERPFGKSEDKPLGSNRRRDESSPKKSFGKRSDNSGESSRRSSGASSSKPFKKFDKGRGDSSESRGYGKRSSDASERAPRRATDSSSRPFKKFDKRGSDSSESKGYGKRSDSPERRPRRASSSTSKPFGKYDKREGGDSAAPRREGSSSKGYGKRSDSSERTPRRPSSSTSKPFGKYDKREGGDSAAPKREGSSSKGYSKRSDSSERTPRRSSSSTSKSFGKYEKRGDDRISQRGKRFSGEEKTDNKSAGSGKFEAGEEAKIPSQSGKIRLNKFIANSGVCSRREADELITMNLISVNGKVITELGYKVNPGDEVRYESRVLRAEKPVYILMNKPKGYLTTTDDPQERSTVMQIIGGAIKERIYPVGRLDRNTTGLLLLTNDGELAEKLMHPSYNVKKIYKVELDKPLVKADFETILEGVHLEEGKAIVDDLAVVSDDGKTIGVELHIGWNRIVRRIFESLNYEVIKLDRVVYAGLDKKDLARGHWRFLTREEITRIKHFNQSK